MLKGPRHIKQLITFKWFWNHIKYKFSSCDNIDRAYFFKCEGLRSSTITREVSKCLHPSTFVLVPNLSFSWFLGKAFDKRVHIFFWKELKSLMNNPDVTNFQFIWKLNKYKISLQGARYQLVKAIWYTGFNGFSEPRLFTSNCSTTRLLEIESVNFR